MSIGSPITTWAFAGIKKRTERRPVVRRTADITGITRHAGPFRAISAAPGRPRQQQLGSQVDPAFGKTSRRAILPARARRAIFVAAVSMPLRPTGMLRRIRNAQPIGGGLPCIRGQTIQCTSRSVDSWIKKRVDPAAVIADNDRSPDWVRRARGAADGRAPENLREQHVHQIQQGQRQRVPHPPPGDKNPSDQAADDAQHQCDCDVIGWLKTSCVSDPFRFRPADVPGKPTL